MAETREPDRFEAKACDVYAAPEYATEPIACIAAALRAAESSALERAARIARRYSHHAEREIRALIPPAAAPAADSALESMCDCGRHVEGEKYALPAGGHVRAAHVDAPAAETGKAQGTEAPDPERDRNRHNAMLVEAWREEFGRLCDALFPGDNGPIGWKHIHAKIAEILAARAAPPEEP